MALWIPTAPILVIDDQPPSRLKFSIAQPMTAIWPPLPSCSRFSA